MAVKQPEDKKTKRHPKSEKFTFTTDDGDTIQATYVENLPYAFVEELGGLDDKDVQKRFIDEILSDEDKELFKTLTIGEVVDFFKAWQDESALSLGEL
jgi:hypothetical protein